MATNRFGYSDDFVLKNGKVGINSSNPQEKLDVSGLTKAQDLRVTGVSTFTTYEGFLSSNHTVSESITLNENQGLTASLSGEIIVDTGVTITVATAGVGTTTVGVGTNQTATNTLSPTTTTQSGQGVVDSLKVYNTFNPPVGGTNDRPIKAKPGQLYYNQDFKTVEFWDGNNWRQVDYTTQRGRGVFGGGAPGPASATIDFIQISTLGNAVNFGVLTAERNNISSCSSSVRGVFGGGSATSYVNTIDYVTIASEGNAISFGTLSTTNRAYISACSSSTRGLFGGGYTTSPANATVNVIDYIQFSTSGNAVDFGDLFTGRYSAASFSSPTRGIWAGGAPSGTPFNVIDFVTIASTGNAVKFGELTTRRWALAGCSNSVRGISAGGGINTPTFTNIMDYVTIASLGNATYFGDLTQAKNRTGGCASQIRGVFGGNSPTGNVIDYVTIATTGNAQDFGDLTVGRFSLAGCSDSHGGLGGF